MTNKPNLNQDEINNLNRPITPSKIETLIENLSTESKNIKQETLSLMELS